VIASTGEKPLDRAEMKVKAAVCKFCKTEGPGGVTVEFVAGVSADESATPDNTARAKKKRISKGESAVAIASIIS
jgi:hypothetical protein